MELYEKYFLVLWAWMILVSIVTILYIVYLFMFFVPSSKAFSIRTKVLCRYYKPQSAAPEDIAAIEKKLNGAKFGDFYMIYKMKSMMPSIAFYNFLQSISVEKQPEEPLSEVVMDPKERRMMPGGPPQNRRPGNQGPRKMMMR